MKNKSLLIVICFVFLMGTTYLANAVCITAHVYCGNGTGTNALACGNSSADLIKEANAIADAFCGQQQ